MSNHSIIFHKDLISSFWVILLKVRQTDRHRRQHNLLGWGKTCPVLMTLIACVFVRCRYYIRNSRTGSRRWIIFLDGEFASLLQTQATVAFCARTFCPMAFCPVAFCPWPRRMPFFSPNRQCHSTERRNCRSLKVKKIIILEKKPGLVTIC